jgi:hypothetical protein
MKSMPPPTEAERKAFRASLRGVSDEELGNRRNSGEYGTYNPTDARNSSWKVIEINRHISENQRVRNLRPQWYAVWIAVLALVAAIVSLVVSIVGLPK